jgi:L-ribulokinase
VAKAEQACAFGTAMFAAVAAGVYAKVEDAQKAMGQGFAHEYYPNAENHKQYLELYKNYQLVGKFTEEKLFS